MAVIVPPIVNTALNLRIYFFVRSSARRLQPQIASVIVSDSNGQQQPRLNQRDISMIHQIIFMFVIFVVGWLPIYLSIIISEFIYVDWFVTSVTAVFSELCTLIIITHLFIHNHEIRQYLVNSIRQFVGR